MTKHEIRDDETSVFTSSTTMAAADISPYQDIPHTQPSRELNVVPRSPTRNNNNSRHTKGLSLNFPILAPSQPSLIADSPTESSVSPPPESLRGSPRLKPVGLPTPGSVTSLDSPTKKSTDFLTLLAAQERKVLELREELNKAETELSGLKKQWAVYEANKKREDLKHTKKMQPVAMSDVTAVVQDEDELEEERKRRRALVEMNYNANHVAVGAAPKLGRKGSKRVFEGRHTRTLSLLSPVGKTPQKDSISSLNELMEGPDPRKSQDSLLDITVAEDAESRKSTLDTLISSESLQLGFGKTYKNLAANRRSLPPVATDLFVKQGKQMVDGVREGLWTFFEDIRQATVGEEGVSGTVAQQRPSKAANSQGQKTKMKGKQGKPGISGPVHAGEARLQKDDSFWKEFGLGTPDKSINRTNKENPTGHIQQKSSTDSRNPPELLLDLPGTEQEDDEWDAWESPVSLRQQRPSGKNPLDQIKENAGEGLPWPELKKLTPSKLTRTVSDLMREWDKGQTEEVAAVEETDEEKQARILISGHL